MPSAQCDFQPHYLIGHLGPLNSRFLSGRVVYFKIKKATSLIFLLPCFRGRGVGRVHSRLSRARQPYLIRIMQVNYYARLPLNQETMFGSLVVP